mgnify:CR=1 FL=1
MPTLSREFLDRCPVQHGFRLRGENMTRIEVFVDAAFAFAVTLLVISFDHIPQTFDEFILALKGIPAFVIAFAQLVWIWHTHSQWSERYGLRDTGTVFLSATLLAVMLIYIYPMRIMFGGLVSWASRGWFPSSFSVGSYDELSAMFVFMGCGLLGICFVFFLMYRHAIRHRDALQLNEYEFYETETSAICWLGSSAICVLSIVLALTFPDGWLPFAGFGYALFGIWIPAVLAFRERAHENRQRNGNGG